MRPIIIVLLLIGSLIQGVAQNVRTPEEEAEYTKVVTQRADKIVKTLGISDSLKAGRVRDIIATQYKDLNNIHDPLEAKIKSIKSEGKDKTETQKQVDKLEAEANTKLDKLHGEYITKLSKELTAEQVDKVKDGMTYGVLPVTYSGYLDMIPTLKENEKKQIMEYLVEAREHAMDAGSSEKKHWWFGKYKGKINNYLSSAGYDITKERQAWDKRREEASAAKKK